MTFNFESNIQSANNSILISFDILNLIGYLPFFVYKLYE